MAMKDYKKKSLATQPPTKKNTSGDSTFKKTASIFGVGFLSGLLVAGALFITYLNNYHSTAGGNSAYTESAASDTADNKTQPEASASTEASKDRPNSQSIDYQFYKELEEFELPPAPTADTPPQDQTELTIIPSAVGEDFSGNDANDRVDGKAGKDDAGNGNNEDTSPTRYILQAGTFTTALQAQIQRRKIVDLGYKDVHIFQAAYKDAQYHRVWLGPYSELEQAQRIGSALKASQIEVVLRHNLRSFDPQ